ncbi:MFS transporter, partial [Streptomyces millisiae]|nr:hypothetical protein [Streptomyces sp. DSM 44918]
MLDVATFTQAAAGFFVGGIGALGVHLQRALDLSTAQLGLLVSAAQFVPLVGLLVAGELLDRYSERWVVGIGAGVVAVALGAGSLAPGYVELPRSDRHRWACVLCGCVEHAMWCLRGVTVFVLGWAELAVGR